MQLSFAVRSLPSQKISLLLISLLFVRTRNVWYVCLNLWSYVNLRPVQYVKQEEIKPTENGREARAIRLITERASARIGRMAFELARARPRKVYRP